MQAAHAIGSEPDFRHVDVWIFDLDNTLYPADSCLFAQIEWRMTEFVQARLGLDVEEARRVQKTYYREHGTTLTGLMRLHNVDPEAYLAFVHDIDVSVLERDAALAQALSRLPGRRFVFTNGCRHHASRVLERLALAHLFEDLWDIRTIAFRPKPDPDSYRAVLGRAGAAGSRSAMFDDTACNLLPAHALGITTVWLRGDCAGSMAGPEFARVPPDHVHYQTADLRAFLETIRL